MVQTKCAHGCSPNGGQCDYSFFVPLEVVRPYVAARVEQAHDPASIRVQPGEVRAFEIVAVEASEGEILGGSLAAM